MIEGRLAHLHLLRNLFCPRDCCQGRTQRSQLSHTVRDFVLGFIAFFVVLLLCDALFLIDGKVFC